MLYYYSLLNPIFQAFIAGIFTFLVTVLGSSIVFFFKTINKSIGDAMLSISGGIMIAAAFFSLLEPAIKISKKLFLNTSLIILSGFIIGGVVLILCDFLLDYYSYKYKYNNTSFKRSIMLFSSISLHNIPEGLVIGVSFGAIPLGLNSSSLIAAITLVLGISIQNFPEGSAISIPMYQDGYSSFKSFLYGSLSAIVEPIFAVIGALLVLKVQILLPFVMSFAASAMIFVVVKELVPESQTNSRKGLITGLFLLGFSIMMFLELII